MSFVEVTHLSKSYGSIHAVSDFSLSVEQGRIYALVGPDGAGKTSIIRALVNLIEPDGGEARLGETDLLRQFDRAKSRIGYMPQTFSLYPDLSVEENLVFYAGIHGLTGQRYRAKRDYLYEFSNLKPFARRRAGALSGGMKQKLALSCALIHEPRLLLLDEPTTGVDPLSRRQFWDMLASLKQQGVTIIVSTPYMDEVARADRACFIFGGRKLAEGTPQELADKFRGRVYVLSVEADPTQVRRINETATIHAQRFGARLHLYATEDTTIDEVITTLERFGVDASTLAAGQPDLEDAFIQLVETTA